jgi:hypothetical protein
MFPTNFHIIWPSGFRGKAVLEAPMEGSVLNFLKAE